MGTEQQPASILNSLAQVAADLGPVLRPRGDAELLQAIVNTACLAFDAAACSIALLDSEEETLQFCAAAGAGAEATVGIKIPAGRGIGGWTLMSGQAIAVDDLQQDPRFAAEVAQRTGYMPRAMMAIPLESERQVFGVLEVLDRRQTGGDGGDDLEMLSLFARQATLAVETSRIFSDLARALLQSAAAATDDGDLRHALEERMAAVPRPQSDLARLALLFHDLGQLDSDVRLAATRIVEEFLRYVARQRR